MKKKIFIILAAVVIVIVAGTVIGIGVVKSGRSTEKGIPPEETQDISSSAPTNVGEMADYINMVIDDADEQRPKVTNTVNVKINSKTIKCDDNAASELLKEQLENIEKGIESCFEQKETDFFEDIGKCVIMPDIASTDLAMYEYDFCTKCGNIQSRGENECLSCGMSGTLEEESTQVLAQYINYKCPECGLTSNVQLENCERCFCEKEYIVSYMDKYTLTSEVGTVEGKAAFAPYDETAVLESLLKYFNGKAVVNGYYTDVKSNQIELVTDRTTDRLEALTYRKIMTVYAEISFEGDNASLGSCNVSFDMDEDNRYDFLWPSVTVSEKSISINPGENFKLDAELLCSDPEKCKIEWGSTDVSICNVDSEGNVTAGKNIGSCKIYATISFNNKDYNDFCEVNVRNCVEAVKISEKEVTINIGERHTIRTEVFPKDATVKSVKWYSEDPTIAIVDSNGVITALSSGNCIIYSLSDDGYFKANCQVTVK